MVWDEASIVQIARFFVSPQDSGVVGVGVVGGVHGG